MIRKSIISEGPLFLLSDHKKKCLCIANFIIVQCVVMFVGSITVFECVWSPERASFDYYKLASIMYLYDKTACGYRLQDKSVKNLQLSNDTKGLNVLPIKCEPAIVTVSTRLSARTRTYIKLSMVLHIAWMIIAIALKIMIKKNTIPRFLKYILTATFYSCISITFFDLSMAIVYVAHIRQSLTKGMIVRYSGWSVILKLENANDFAGWLPMIATACWMRGVFILALNIYNCRIINHIRKKLQKREFRERCAREANLPIPEPRRHTMRTNILYYRPGELKPYYVNDSRFY